MAKKRNDDFNAGYEAAKEAIRDILNQNGGQGGQGSGGGSGDISDLPMPNIPQGGKDLVVVLEMIKVLMEIPNKLDQALK